MKTYALLSGIVILCALLCGFGNALMVYQNDTQLILTSDQIVYGKIVGVNSAWNAQKTHIETTAQVQVADAFVNSKNASISSGSTIPVTILGGTVGDHFEWVEDQPVFIPNTDAFFYLRKSADGRFAINGQVKGVHSVSTGSTGVSGTTTSSSRPEVERFKEQINKTLLGIPTDLDPPGLRASLPAPAAITGQLNVSATINSVTPSSASAGTDTVITITGSGFGTKSSRASPADVIFFTALINTTTFDPLYATGRPYYDTLISDPNFGDASYTLNTNHIISWSDSQIVVKVPTGITSLLSRRGSASSGFVRVKTDAGELVDIPFAVTFGFPEADGANPKLNSWSSKQVTYYTNLGSNSAALPAIQNAATTWNNAGSSFNFNYGGTSERSYAQDGVSVILFAPVSDQYTLGRTSCGGTIPGGINECDLVLNSNWQWTTGTASGTTINIEHITAHEMGHFLTLMDLYGEYVDLPSDTNKLMFGYTGDSYGNMNLKTLSSGDVAGIQWIYPPINLPTDYPQKIGITNGQQWYLDWNGNGAWDGTTDRVSSFGAVGWTPVTGDWDGNGNINIGVSNGQTWYLDWNENGVWDGASVDRVYNFGAYRWKPVVGDWNNDGRTNIGITNGQQWYLDYNGDGMYTAGTDKTYNFGSYGWTPVVGKWNSIQ